MGDTSMVVVALWAWAGIAWFALSFLAGMVGDEKGDGFRTSFLVGLFFSPVLALLYAGALPDKPKG